MLLDMLYLQGFHLYSLKAHVPCQQYEGCTSCCISPTSRSSGGHTGFKEAPEGIYNWSLGLPDHAQGEGAPNPAGGRRWLWVTCTTSSTPQHAAFPLILHPAILRTYSDSLGGTAGGHLFSLAGRDQKKSSLWLGGIARGHLIFLLAQGRMLMTLLAGTCPTSS